MDNKFQLKVLARNQNDAFARSVVSAFCLPLNPTIDQIDDIKTAVSEAFTNCIVHAYGGDSDNYITINACIKNDFAEIIIEDDGCGIDNVEEALQPFFTTKPEQERSGMGFTVMKTFMDKIEIITQKNKGTKICMQKIIKKEA